MTITSSQLTPSQDDVFANLEGVCADRGLGTLAARLVELRTWLADDLADVERAVRHAGSGETVAHSSMRHLLGQDGKRLRPICVALAARTGGGFTASARAYAVAAELVHNATLLHDDVVDLGDVRRGAPAARVIYGNAASIFGGDWLLIDALCRIQSTGQPAVLSRMLDVIKEMVVAESLQLARRGKVRASAVEYFRVIEGKTASLFRWAMFAGAHAGGADAHTTLALEGYGQKLGVAFQLVDDLLDFAGDPAATGKAVLTDLREGKVTYPLILAMERDPNLGLQLEHFCSSEDSVLDVGLAAHIARAMTSSGIVEECLGLATRLCQEAAKSLDTLPVGRARSALEDVAIATARRRK